MWVDHTKPVELASTDATLVRREVWRAWRVIGKTQAAAARCSGYGIFGFGCVECALRSSSVTGSTKENTAGKMPFFSYIGQRPDKPVYLS